MRDRTSTPGVFSVGHGLRRLDVPAGTPMGGYADRDEVAGGTLDPLEVHVLSISDGTRRFVLVVADVVCVNTDVVAATREALVEALPGTTADTVWLSATHTHAGPDTGCRPGGDRTPAKWTERVTAAALAAADDAVRAESPGSLVLRRGELHGVGGQRSAEKPRLSVPYAVLEVAAGGCTRGVVVVLPVHPTVLGADNLRTSADLPGAVRREVAAAPQRPWCVVATGAAGDVSTRPHRREQTAGELSRLGGLVGQQVLDLLATPGTDVGGDGAIGAVAARKYLALPPRSADEPAGPPHRCAQPDDPVARRTAYTREQGMRLAHLARAVRDPRCAVAVLTVGDLRLAAVGAEPFLDADAAWRAAAGRTGMLFGYTGGYLGYLPTAAAYAAPEYEVSVSPCGPAAADTVLAECGRLLSSSPTRRM